MILEDATHEAFGYYPSALKPKSNKRILATCDECGKIRAIRMYSYHSLCMSCSQKGRVPWNKGKISEFLIGKIGDKSLAWKGGEVKRICTVCGNEFYVPQCQVKKGYGNYCSISCSTKSRAGEEAANWKGGLSFEPYCIKFNKDYKEGIRERFERKCFLCDMTEEGNGRALDVHHVNYNKDCGCDDTVCICVPLCHSCHSKTNGNRDYWQTLIMQKLKNTLLGW